MESLMKIFLIFALPCFAAAKSYSSKKPDGELRLLTKTSTKTYYISQDSAYYEAAKKSCEISIGGQLASIETPEDAKLIRKQLQGIAVDNIWVGGTVNYNSECSNYDTFHKECWMWEQSQNPIDDAVIPWTNGIESKPQNRFYRTTLQTGAIALKIVYNTTPNVYLCESESYLC